MATIDLVRRTLEALDWPYLREALAVHARTPLGARQARELLPLGGVERVVEMLDAVSEVERLHDLTGGDVPLGGIEDIGEQTRRAERGETLDLAELRAAVMTVAGLAAVRRYGDEHVEAAPVLARWSAGIEVDRQLARALAAALDERGQLSETTYPLLGELRRKILTLERRARALLDELVAGPLADVLQDTYVTVRNDRLVVPVKAQAKASDIGIVHDASRTGQTVFVEPHRVVPLNNERRIAEAELAAEEQRILRELSHLLGRHHHALTAALAAAAEIDLAWARAAFARCLAAVRPEVSRAGVVKLRAARHPVLVLRDVEVIANDLSLTAARPLLVLTGPNAGGKTVALKTIGLCALLAASGCFVPAGEGSRVDYFDDLLADIGDQQTVHEGLSSFSGHLATLREMLEQARPGCLLLLDELASGTDPAQGGALACALLESFVERGASVVTTTHYGQVKALAETDRRASLVAMEYRDGEPTYRVVAGKAGSSHALAAALRAGIEERLVERARSLMSDAERAMQGALERLESERADYERLAREAARALATAGEREAAAAEREAKVRGRARELEQEQARVFLERLRAAEREVARIVAELQRGPSSAAAEAARAELRDLANSAEPSAPAASVPIEHLEPGMRVRVARIGLVGEIDTVGARTIEVRVGGMTVSTTAGEIELVDDAGTRRAERPARKSGTTTVVSASHVERMLRTLANTLDLRGARVEEGLARLERFLDDAILRGEDAVFVLHGHGTGAMKKAVREWLTTSTYAAATAPATPDQGGDAFTVVVLKS